MQHVRQLSLTGLFKINFVPHALFLDMNRVFSLLFLPLIIELLLESKLFFGYLLSLGNFVS